MHTSTLPPLVDPTESLRRRADRYRSLAASAPDPLSLAYRRRAAELDLRAHVAEQVLYPTADLVQAA